MVSTLKCVCFELLLYVLFCDGSDMNQSNFDGNGKVLSRKKRYLIFPEGASFQLVFCLQTPVLVPIGDILLFANTAALAWMLPTDPKAFHQLSSDKLKEAQNKMGLMRKKRFLLQQYGEESYSSDGNTLHSVRKRNVTQRKRPDIKIDKKRMHEKQSSREFLKMESTLSRFEFHRKNRLELIERLELLFTSLGNDGRQYVLRKLCETAKISTAQKPFLQELLHVIFTLPKGERLNEAHFEYDEAHKRSDVDCNAMFPSCDDSNSLS